MNIDEFCTIWINPDATYAMLYRDERDHIGLHDPIAVSRLLFTLNNMRDVWSMLRDEITNGEWKRFIRKDKAL